MHMWSLTVDWVGGLQHDGNKLTKAFLKYDTDNSGSLDR